MAMDAYGNYLPQPGDPTQLGGTGQLLVGQIPAGGSAGQVLTKGSGSNFDLVWAAGGGAGTDFNLDGAVDPTSNPSDTTKTWLYANTATGTFWVWPANAVAWQQIV
jgi:hypothetical protein